jgi:hypothetical protein
VEFTADPRSKNVNENGLNGTTADIAGWPYQNYECVALPAELPRRLRLARYQNCAPIATANRAKSSSAVGDFASPALAC